MLLREMDFRQRTLKITEMAVFTSLFKQLLLFTVDLFKGDAKETVALKRRVGRDVEKLMGAYEAEVFHDRYHPAFKHRQDELSRREKAEAKVIKEREAIALAKVSAFSESAKKKR